MKLNIEGIDYIEQWESDPVALFNHLMEHVSWDTQMASRQTASYGHAYNYSQMTYPFRDMMPEIEALCESIEKNFGYRPNNCLINLYADRQASMGYHADQTDILSPDTGISILSLGAVREISFRKESDHQDVKPLNLASGSLLHMDQSVQSKWKHAIKRLSQDIGVRMSLAFRNIQAEVR